ncbi:hypothetical protein CHU98_g11873 [Xylaria longipes]|nr:hypothetical protein CHU98_g11873 [Xylaria longipes]
MTALGQQETVPHTSVDRLGHYEYRPIVVKLLQMIILKDVGTCANADEAHCLSYEAKVNPGVWLTAKTSIEGTEVLSTLAPSSIIRPLQSAFVRKTVLRLAWEGSLPPGSGGGMRRAGCRSKILRPEPALLRLGPYFEADTDAQKLIDPHHTRDFEHSPMSPTPPSPHVELPRRLVRLDAQYNSGVPEELPPPLPPLSSSSSTSNVSPSAACPAVRNDADVHFHIQGLSALDPHRAQQIPDRYLRGRVTFLTQCGRTICEFASEEQGSSSDPTSESISDLASDRRPW